MKNIFKTSLLLIAALCMTTACSDDNDSNPKLDGNYTMELYTPAVANSYIDLANSNSIELVCSTPNYGFPAAMLYDLYVATDENMTDATLMETYSSGHMNVSATKLAQTLTTLMLAKDETLTEDDFPLEIPVYMRVVAHIVSADAISVAEVSKTTSNVVKLNKVKLEFSLPPVALPENIYAIGAFCDKNWDNALTFVPTYDFPDILWHLVYIDGDGIKLNTTQADDENVITYDMITVSGDKADEIINKDGWIASSNPGWYLVVVTSVVDGRNINYNVAFDAPNVYLMGTCTPGGWTELQDDMVFTVPATADDYFVSPAFIGAPTDDGGLRAYVKLSSAIDWWKSEFMLFDGKIVYRGAGGDQDRIMNVDAGQKLYLNFTKETGKIE